MLYLLVQLIRTVFTRRRPLVPPVIIAAVFLTSWPLMWWAEPVGSVIVRPANYWWWFVATCSTVGYGDYTPKTTAGRFVALYVIIGGITALTALLAQLSLLLDHLKGRRMNGTGTVDHSGHIVILGYTPGRTEGIVDDLLDGSGRRVVLSSWPDHAQHPMAELPVDFIRGDLTDDDVLRRAGAHRAYGVLVDARSDDEAMTVALTVRHVAPDVLMVVALRDLGRTTHLRYIQPDARGVQWHHPHILGEELRTPGIAEVYLKLMTHGAGSTFSVVVPPLAGALPLSAWQLALGREYGATVIAVRAGQELLVAPPWETAVPSGATLYYVGRRRLDTADLAIVLSEDLTAVEVVTADRTAAP